MGGAKSQWMDFDAALAMIESGIEISKIGQDVIVRASGELHKSRVLIYQNRFDEAFESILNIKKQAELFALPPWMHHSAEAIKAGIWVAKSKLDLVEAWVRERGLDVDDELSHRREPEHFAFAAYLIARGQFEHAQALLSRLIEEAKTYDRIYTLIELLILRAIVHQQLGNMHSAINDCSTALSLAEPGSFLASFVSRGDSVESILQTIENTFKKADYQHYSFSKNYLKRLLAAFKVKEADTANQQLQEPLSDRELDVLMLIAAGLSNQQIADKLFISLNTTKSHLKRINAKLGTHSRTEAVHRAQEFGLL
jgi:LuxR family maltose regulon positive regulatory protein